MTHHSAPSSRLDTLRGQREREDLSFGSTWAKLLTWMVCYSSAPSAALPPQGVFLDLGGKWSLPVPSPPQGPSALLGLRRECLVWLTLSFPSAAMVRVILERACSSSERAPDLQCGQRLAADEKCLPVTRGKAQKCRQVSSFSGLVDRHTSPSQRVAYVSDVAQLSSTQTCFFLT